MLALSTTIRNGVNILKDGYAYARHTSPCYIVAGTKEGSVYTLTMDAAKEVKHCTCDAHAWLGTCKHVVGLYLHKAAIDAMNDEREEQERMEAARLAEEAKKPAETFVIVKAWSSWEAFWADCDLKKVN